MPDQLTGTGVVAAELVRGLLASAEQAVEPLRAEHARELERLTEEATAFGEKSLPGRKEITDRFQREERRWRTDALRAGLGALARAYRDRLTNQSTGAVRRRQSRPGGRRGGGTHHRDDAAPWSATLRSRCCCRPSWCVWVRWRRSRLERPVPGTRTTLQCCQRLINSATLTRPGKDQGVG